MPVRTKPKTDLGKQLSKRLPQKRSSSKPVWDGPCSTTPQGGVTQSLFSRWLCDKERARLLLIEGLKPVDEFSVRLEYGNLHHAAEQQLAAGKDWQEALLQYAKQLGQKYPTSGPQITHWYHVCKTQFPLYVKWWKDHPDVQNRTLLYQERVFKVPYTLPSGRIAYLRGKWDSVDTIKQGKVDALFLQENKSKADIDEQAIQTQLLFDLQTMVYAIALEIQEQRPVAGVRYNVVRRPLAGGKHSIKQREPTQGSKCNLKSCKDEPSRDCPKCRGTGRYDAKPGETPEEFYARLGGLIEGAHGPDEGLPVGQHYYFMRWKVDITAGDIAKFKEQFLNPALENLADDYEWWEFCKANDEWNPFDYKFRQAKFPGHISRHQRLPYGIWNPLIEGRSTDMDEFLNSGSEVGLRRVTTLFNELEE